MKDWLWIIGGAAAAAAADLLLPAQWLVSALTFGIGLFAGLRSERARWLREVEKLRG